MDDSRPAGHRDLVLLKMMALAALLPAIALGQAPSSGTTVRVRVATTAGPVPDVILSAARLTAVTDAGGTAVLHPEPGPLTITVRRLGLAPDSSRFEVRAGMDTTIAFVLREQAAAMAA